MFPLLFLQLHKDEFLGDIQDQLMEATVGQTDTCVSPLRMTLSFHFTGQVSSEVEDKANPVLQADQGKCPPICTNIPPHKHTHVKLLPAMQHKVLALVSWQALAYGRCYA